MDIQKYLTFQNLVIATVILIVVIAIKKGLEERKEDKRQRSQSYDKTDVPSSFNAEQLSQRFYNSFADYNFLDSVSFGTYQSERSKCFDLTVGWTDSQIIFLYNTFNKLYAKKLDMTLTELIQSETYNLEERPKSVKFIEKLQSLKLV